MIKLLNLTNNSIYLDDIDLYIPHQEDEPQIIKLQDLKKSEMLQSLIVTGNLKIIECGKSRIEQNMLRLSKEYSEKSSQKDDDTLNEDTKEFRVTDSDVPSVVIKGNFHQSSGYAKVNRNLAIGLALKKYNVEIKSLNKNNSTLNEMESRQISSLQKPINGPKIAIDSIIPSFTQESSRAHYKILYTTIEAASVPQQTIDMCDRYDEIWLTSDFSLEVLQNSGVKKPMYVIPPGVQSSLYNENHEPHVFSPSLKSFAFCALGQWQYRKGWDALLRAYLTEFNDKDDVSLLIISKYMSKSEHSKYIQNEVQKKIIEYGGDNPAHIARCGRSIPEFDLPKFYKACNAFVLPSRGEGFGLPFIESSLCGLPVIATNFSGQTMFLNDENSFPVDPDEIEKVPPHLNKIHYWDNQLMPSLRSDDFSKRLGETMRYVHNNYDEALEKNKKLQKEILNNYTIDASCKTAGKRIQEIWDNLKNKE